MYIPGDPLPIQSKINEDRGIRFIAWISLAMEDTKKTDARCRITGRTPSAVWMKEKLNYVKKI